MKRNIGIDALKILSMFMIVILHILGQGGILATLPQFSMRYNISWLLEIMCLCSVNCFAIASGYLSADRQYTYKGIINLWLQVIFYSLVLIGIMKFVTPETINYTYITKAFLPTMAHSYWYFTAYFGLYLFMPLLNIIIDKTPKMVLFSSLFFILSFTSIGGLFNSNFLWEAGGYSTIWLMIMYLIGGMVKKYKIRSKDCLRNIFYFLIFCGINFFLKLVIEKFFSGTLYLGNLNYTLVNYTSPFLVLASIHLFMFFEQYVPKKKINKKVIVFFAPLSFGVYLIHTNAAIWENVMKNNFIFITNYLSFKFVLLIFMSAILIFVGCAFIDYFRIKLFKICRLNILVDKIEKKINSIF